MRRLYKISFDIAISSITQIFLWFCLSLIIDKNLINVFSITYPLQFIYMALISIFSTGANISKEYDHNKYAAFSGIVVGLLVAIVLFGFIILNMDKYLLFMNVDVERYKVISIFSVITLFLYLVLAFILNKLYFDNNVTLANKYSFMFNFIYVVVLIVTALYFTDNILIVVTITALALSIYVLFIFCKTMKQIKKELTHLKLKMNFLSFIKYDSVDLSTHFINFLIYLIGFKTSFKYGQDYVTTLTFCSMITDTQWDSLLAISTVAKIDIAQDNFIYKDHIKNGYCLALTLLSTIIISFICLHSYYALDYRMVFIMLGIDLTVFMLYPVYGIKTYIVQYKCSSKIATINKIISLILRFLCSFIPVSFCVYIGQVVGCLYQFIYLNRTLDKYKCSS